MQLEWLPTNSGDNMDTWLEYKFYCHVINDLVELSPVKEIPLTKNMHYA